MVPNRSSIFVDRHVATYNKHRAKPVSVAPQGHIVEKVGRGFTIFQSTERLSRALGVRTNEKWSKADVWRAFKEMDADGSGELDKQELEKWVLTHKIFEETSLADTRHKMEYLFKDLDKTGDCQVDFEEFYNFCKLLEREQRSLSWANKHYLTSLPQSHHELTEKKWTLDYIEKELHKKIEQFTSQDKDRFRQVLGMFRTQVQKSRDGMTHEVLGITRRDFQKMLAWLGLFATQPQAMELFTKFDVNGDGFLTVHEFLTKARPEDYPGSRRAPVRMYNENKGGKKIYQPLGGPARGGDRINLNTPNEDVYYFDAKQVRQTIRDKLSKSGKVGQIYPDAQGRRDLIQTFLFFDKKHAGIVTVDQFARAMKMINVNNLGGRHLESLYRTYGKQPNGVPCMDYPKFASFVFPDYEKNPDHFINGTSLELRGKVFEQEECGNITFYNATENRGRPTRAQPVNKARTVACLDGRPHLGSKGGIRPMPQSQPGSSRRSLNKSASTAVMPGRRSKTAERTLSHSASAPNGIKSIKTQKMDDDHRAFEHTRVAGEPAERAVTKIEGVMPEKQVNPLMAQMPSNTAYMRSMNKNSIIL